MIINEAWSTKHGRLYGGVDGVVGSHLGACLGVRGLKDFLTAKEHGFVLRPCCLGRKTLRSLG